MTILEIPLLTKLDDLEAAQGGLPPSISTFLCFHADF